MKLINLVPARPGWEVVQMGEIRSTIVAALAVDSFSAIVFAADAAKSDAAPAAPAAT